MLGITMILTISSGCASSSLSTSVVSSEDSSPSSLASNGESSSGTTADDSSSIPTTTSTTVSSSSSLTTSENDSSSSVPVSSSPDSSSQTDYGPYYGDLNNVADSELKTTLRTIISVMTLVSYGDARYILDETDADPANSANLIVVYRGTSVSGVWDDGVTWNREHVWPQSLLNVSVSNTSKNVGSDLHNLKPANPSENSSRGNKYFDYMTSTVAYAPRDAVKGDIARILFYMETRYSNLTLISATPTTYQMALLDSLVEWNKIDPVDDFERNRNEVIFGYQANRNPYIDYPELVCRIWGDVSTRTRNSCNA